MKDIISDISKMDKKDLVRKTVYWTSSAALAGVAIPTCATLFALGAPVFVPAGVVAMAFLGNRAVWAVTVKKEEAIKEIDEKSIRTKEKIEVCGKMLQSTADKTGIAFVQGCKIAKCFGESAYRELGGTEGAKKAIDGMGKVLEEVGKLGVHAAIVTAKVVNGVVKEVNKQFEGRSRSTDSNLLDNAAEIVNFVVMDD